MNSLSTLSFVTFTNLIIPPDEPSLYIACATACTTNSLASYNDIFSL